MLNGDIISNIGVLVGGIGGLFAGIAALLPYIRFRKLVIITGIILVIFSVSIITIRVYSGQNKPLNVQLTTQALDAFDKGDYQNAVIYADKCIDEYCANADREEVRFENSRAPIPPTGIATSVEKKAIWARALLNDVATSCYIKGRSFENMGQKDKAIEAYKTAAKYTYGRCWDPKGWFWSPAEVSSDRLAMLERNAK